MVNRVKSIERCRPRSVTGEIWKMAEIRMAIEWKGKGVRYDPKTQDRGLSTLFAQKKSKNGPAPKSGNIQDARRRRKARAGSPIFQTALEGGLYEMGIAIIPVAPAGVPAAEHRFSK
jgi:hypothetical protein